MANLKDAAPIDLNDELKNLPFYAVGVRIILKEMRVEKTSGGVYVPETARGSNTGSMGTMTGVVLDMGPEVRSEYVGDINVGDVVYTGRYAMANCPVNDREYVFINDEDVLAVFSDEDVTSKVITPDEEGSDD